MRKLTALCLVLLSSLAVTAVAQMKAPYQVKVICGVVKSDSWLSTNTQEGIYEMDLATGALTKLTEGKDVFQAPLGGAVYENGTMKGIHFKTVWDAFDQANTYILYHVEYDMETWTRTFEKTLGDMDRNYISSCGLARNMTTGVNYGIFYNFNMSWQVVNRKLATIDFSTPVPTRGILGTVTTPMAAIACDKNGILYGVGQDGFLYAISTAPAESEVEVMPLGDLGVENISTNPSSMVYNQFTGKFLWSVVLNTGKSYLYEIDPTIGQVAATQLMQVPDNAYLVNMFIPDPVTANDAPAAVTDLAAHFEGTSTTGTVTFTAPTTTYTGDELTGMLTYTVTANGQTVATGEVEAGAQATADVTVPAGDVTIVVTVANEAGTSPEAKIDVYAGPDRPLAPQNVTFDYNPVDKVSMLSWNAPALGEHATELVPEELVYNVYLMPEGTQVAEAVSETALELPFDPETLALYYYKVEAVNAGMTGEAGLSNRAVVGPALDVPYVQNFTSASSFDLLTVLDRNEDNNTWVWEKNFGSNTGRAYMGATNDDTNDDWLLSPPINLKKGATYRLTFDANCYTAANVCYLDAAYGEGLRPESYTAVMDRLTLATPVTDTYTSNDIVPERTGVYYFGFHDVSLPHYGALLLKNFSITMVKDAPALVDGDVTGDGKVDVEDVNAVINIILKLSAVTDYPGNADVKADDKIDVEDVNAIINRILKV